jgi:hypothetical protein
MRPFIGIRAVVRPVPEKINVAVPNPYRMDLFLLLAASKSVPSLCLGNRASSLLQTLLQKNRNFSSLALSQSLNLSWKE